jgi:hypothetical protein
MVGPVTMRTSKEEWLPEASSSGTTRFAATMWQLRGGEAFRPRLAGDRVARVDGDALGSFANHGSSMGASGVLAIGRYRLGRLHLPFSTGRVRGDSGLQMRMTRNSLALVSARSRRWRGKAVLPPRPRSSRRQPGPAPVPNSTS